MLADAVCGAAVASTGGSSTPQQLGRRMLCEGGSGRSVLYSRCVWTMVSMCCHHAAATKAADVFFELVSASLP